MSDFKFFLIAWIPLTRQLNCQDFTFKNFKSYNQAQWEIVSKHDCSNQYVSKTEMYTIIAWMKLLFTTVFDPPRLREIFQFVKIYYHSMYEIKTLIMAGRVPQPLWNQDNTARLNDVAMYFADLFIFQAQLRLSANNTATCSMSETVKCKTSLLEWTQHFLCMIDQIQTQYRRGEWNHHILY